MASNALRRLSSLDLEEKILNIGAIVAIVGVFLPWAGGQLLGSDTLTFSGFGFYSSFIGLTVFVLHTFILMTTLLPVFGGPVLLRKERKDFVRLFCAVQATVLILAALSVLMRVSLEFSRMEIRFGIYVSLIGSIVALLYSYLRVQEQRKSEVHELFHHPETNHKPAQRHGQQELSMPPPQHEPEEHHLHV